LDFYGRPEDFKLIGKEIYREIPCYVLEYDMPDHISRNLAYRWFVGQSDGLLYGLQTRRNGRLTGEHWTLDYREVVPGGWFPMKTGWSSYGANILGWWTHPESTRSIRVVEFKLNQSLPEDLFHLIIEPGVEIQDHRSGELRRYKKWPSLLGKTLPSLEKFNLPESFSPKGVPVLFCFMDLGQRPSRHLIAELKDYSETLRSNSVTVLLIQSADMSPERLNQWREQLDITYEIATMVGDLRAIRWSWGVEALPWLILTDRDHVVTAEGFGLDELEDKIRETKDAQ
jgi:hypothetical protein